MTVLDPSPPSLVAGLPAPRESGPSIEQLALLRRTHGELLAATRHGEVARVAADVALKLVASSRSALVERTVEGSRVTAESPSARRAAAPWAGLFGDPAPWDSGARVRDVVPDDVLEITVGTAVLAVPVAAVGRVLGSLVVRRAGDRPYSPGDEDVLARLGRLVGAALERVGRRGSVHVEAEEPEGLPDGEALLGALRSALRVSMAPALPVALVVVRVGAVAARLEAGRTSEGEALVEAVADVLRSSLRPGDELFRWQGDELAVMLPETTRGQAVRVTIRLRAAMAGVCAGLGVLDPGIEVGWAIGEALSPVKLVQRARSAMTPSRAEVGVR